MATIHAYKEAKATSQGLWIKSADGGPEIYLGLRDAMALAEAIMKQQRGSRSAQRSAPTMQRAAAPALYSAPVAQFAGKQFVGKSSFSPDDPRWKDHAAQLAKTRATKKYRDYVSRAYLGKAAPRATERSIVGSDGQITHVITLG